MKKIIGYILITIAIINVIGFLYLSSSNPSKLSNNSNYFTKKIITALIFGGIGIWLLTSAPPKKKASNKDYLSNSGNSEIDEAIKEDKLSLYNSIINDENHPDELKKIVQDFLLKYKISQLKYGINQDFIKDTYKHAHIEKHSESKYVSPSLLQMVNTPKMTIKLYPNWFYASFPDVITWATYNKGENIVSIAKKYDDKDLGSINYNLLTEIIDSYLQHFEDLECTVNYKHN